MYGHGFQDLDGRIWELIFMEPSGKVSLRAMIYGVGRWNSRSS
jgi:hypothetical protein